MDLKLPKMLCKDSKQHHVIFHELNPVSSFLCIAQNVRFEIPYKDLHFETSFLMIFKYHAWASYAQTCCESCVIISCFSFVMVMLVFSWMFGKLNCLRSCLFRSRTDCII